MKISGRYVQVSSGGWSQGARRYVLVVVVVVVGCSSSVCICCVKAVAVRSPSDSSTSTSTATDGGAGDGAAVELEMDQLNQHECMSSLVSLLRHMRLNTIMPAVEQVITVFILPSKIYIRLVCYVIIIMNYGCTEYLIRIRTGPNSGPNGLFVFRRILPRFGTRIRIVDNCPRGHAAPRARDETQQLILASVMKPHLSW